MIFNQDYKKYKQKIITLCMDQEPIEMIILKIRFLRIIKLYLQEMKLIIHIFDY